MRRLAVALTLVAVLPFVVPPAFAATPLDSGGASGGSGWVAWKLHMDGAPVVATVRADGARGVFGGGFMLFSPSGSLVFAEADAYSTVAHGVTLSERAVAVGTLRQTLVGDGGTGRADVMRTLTLSTSPGEWRLLVYAAGPADAWSYTLETYGGATLGGKTVGARSLLVDMGSPASAGGVALRAHAFDAGARADLLAAQRLDVVNGLYLTTVSAGADNIDVRGPGGAAVSCQRPGAALTTFLSTPCSFADARPGAYGVSLTGAGAGVREGAEFLVLGADARLPG